MTPAGRTFGAGAVLAGLGVAAGAFGAHALRDRLEPPALQAFETAVRYQIYHALVLLMLGRLVSRHRDQLLSTAAGLFIAGVMLFSGSLYALSLSGIRAFGAVTPFGGVALLAGWALLAVAGPRALSRP